MLCFTLKAGFAGLEANLIIVGDDMGSEMIAIVPGERKRGDKFLGRNQHDPNNHAHMAGTRGLAGLSPPPGQGQRWERARACACASGV